MSSTSLPVPINSSVVDFLKTPKKLLIDGRQVEAASGKIFETYNPATGEVLAKVAEGDKEDIHRAARAARRAFDDGPWSRMTPSKRGQLIWRLAELLEQDLDEFAQIETLDNGKPFSVARVADVPLAVDLFVTCRDGRPRLAARQFLFRPVDILLIRSASQSESLDKSFLGTSRC